MQINSPPSFLSGMVSSFINKSVSQPCPFVHLNMHFDLGAYLLKAIKTGRWQGCRLIGMLCATSPESTSPLQTKGRDHRSGEAQGSCHTASSHTTDGFPGEHCCPWLSLIPFKDAVPQNLGGDQTAWKRMETQELWVRSEMRLSAAEEHI